MSATLFDVGRARTHAMSTMNLRAVINDDGRLAYLSRSSSSGGDGTVLARHQPRDARGRFVSYQLFGWVTERDLRGSSHGRGMAD